jgi:broad specificity phosphatase PhoE
MNTQLWLVRHGETEWNAAGKFQGCFDDFLNATLVSLNDTSHLPIDYKLKSFV